MLTFIKGTSGTPRTQYIRRKILELVKEGNDKIVLVVPEQFSFETEKAMLELMGATLFNKIQVTSFSFMALNILKRENCNKIRLDDKGRRIFINLILNNFKDEIGIFKTSANIADIGELMIDIILKLKLYGISNEKLKQNLNSVQEDELKLKLKTISNIYDEYELQISSSYIDPINDLNTLCEILSEKYIFEDYTFFFDSFTAFTYDELQVIKHISLMAKDMFFSLCMDDGDKYNEYDLFSPVKKTATTITNLLNCTVQEIYLTENTRFKNDELKFLENNVFRNKKNIYSEKPKNISIYEATDIYDEVDFIARKIKELVISEGYNYSDFAIIGRDISVFEGILDACLEKHNIPYFLDTPEKIDTKALMTLVLSIFDIINNSFKKEDIFRYLKTGLTKFTVNEISLLENYSLIWDINSNDWFQEFTQNPRGFTDNKTKEDEKLLKELNALRKDIIDPLCKFKDEIKQVTADEICKKLYELLLELKVPQKLEEYSNELYEKGEYKLSEEQSRLWQLLVDILDRMYVILKGQKVKVTIYQEILKNIFAKETIAFVPKALDEVSIGNVDRMRPANPKISFVISAVDGEFPKTKTKKNIFSYSEFNKLNKIGINIAESISEFSANEHLFAYFALTSACEKLFISYHKNSLKGEENKASVIVRQMLKIFPKIKVESCLNNSYEELIWDKTSAFDLLSTLNNKNKVIKNTLYEILVQDANYLNKLTKLDNKKNDEKFIFKDRNNSYELFAKNNKNISASQVEKYYLCPFSYFCRYGLKAKIVKKAQLDAIEYGSLVHYVLEKIFKKYTVSYLIDIENSKLRQEIAFILDEYVNIKLGGYKNKAERFKFLLSKCVSSSCVLVKYIADELNISGFKPSDFELEIGKDKHPFSINLANGNEININGYIDRVDLIEKENINYVRIVDYKTGIKEFKLSDVLYGLNMQMLIYLDALLKSNKSKKLQAAGILYMPSTIKAVTASRNISKEKAKKLNGDRISMNGLMINNANINANLTVKKENILENSNNENNNITNIEIILANIEKLTAQMAVSLREGKVPPLPVKGEYDACKFCDYSSVCSYEEGDNCRTVVKFSNEIAIKKMLERLQDE